MQNYLTNNYLKQIKNEVYMNTLKAKIKSMSEEQGFFKGQRKTVFFQGERKISAQEATFKHAMNRQRLKAANIAYAILREKDPVATCAAYENLFAWEKARIEKVLKDYQQEFADRKAKYEARQKAYLAQKENAA